MSTARFSDAVAALFAAFTGAAPLAAVTVTDGPAPTAQFPGDFVIVGHDGTTAPDGSLTSAPLAGRLIQVVIEMGSPPVKEETGVINCVAVSQTGDAGDIAGRLAQAQVLTAACEDACLDLRSGTIVFDATGSADVRTRQGSGGCAAWVAFTVGYTVPW